jgi:hypothetical protein
LHNGFQRGFATLLIIAVALASNLHLPLVQAVAWTRMYAQYRETYTPDVALKITFSGQYPCALCKVVQSAEKERNNLAGKLSPAEHVWLLPLPRLLALTVTPPADFSGRWHDLALNLPAARPPPATPPPRLA